MGRNKKKLERHLGIKRYFQIENQIARHQDRKIYVELQSSKVQ